MLCSPGGADDPTVQQRTTDGEAGKEADNPVAKQHLPHLEVERTVDTVLFRAEDARQMLSHFAFLLLHELEGAMASTSRGGGGGGQDLCRSLALPHARLLYTRD